MDILIIHGVIPTLFTDENNEVILFETIEIAIKTLIKNELIDAIIVNRKTSFVLNCNINYYEDLVLKAKQLFALMNETDIVNNLTKARELIKSQSDLPTENSMYQILLSFVLMVAGSKDKKIVEIVNIVNNALDSNIQTALKHMEEKQ